jgi:hypothetical protein
LKMISATIAATSSTAAMMYPVELVGGFGGRLEGRLDWRITLPSFAAGHCTAFHPVPRKGQSDRVYRKDLADVKTERRISVLARRLEL